MADFAFLRSTLWVSRRIFLKHDSPHWKGNKIQNPDPGFHSGSCFSLLSLSLPHCTHAFLFYRPSAWHPFCRVFKSSLSRLQGFLPPPWPQTLTVASSHMEIEMAQDSRWILSSRVIVSIPMLGTEDVGLNGGSPYPFWAQSWEG